MPQMIRQDSIPRMLVASTTTATLAITSGGQPTLITVGGQQYQPASLLTLNAATVGANGLDAGSLGASQLWYVYAIAHQTSFAMALVASLSATPTMPTGYGTAYKLIGAFNTNASSQVSFTVVPEDGVVYPVSARNVIGDVTGVAVPAGYIGEKTTGASATTEAPISSSSLEVYVDSSQAGTITLGAGVWNIQGVLASGFVNATGATVGLTGSIRTSGNSVVVEVILFRATTGVAGNNGWGGGVFGAVVVLSTSTTYKLSYKATALGGGAATTQYGINAGGQPPSYIYAVRIA